jgi:hypothetical protein
MIQERKEKYSEIVVEKEESYEDDDSCSEDTESSDDDVEKETTQQKSIVDDREDPQINVTSSTNYSEEVPYEKLEETVTTVLDSSIDVLDAEPEPPEIEEKIESFQFTEESEKTSIFGDTLTNIDLDILLPDNSDNKNDPVNCIETDGVSQRRSASLSLQDQFEQSASSLVRSNSYTLDQPSPLLLKRMAAEGIFFGAPETSDTLNKSHPPQKTKTKPQKGPSILAPKLKKSPYDIKLSKSGSNKKKKNIANFKSKKIASPVSRQKIVQELKESEKSGCCKNIFPEKLPDRSSKFDILESEESILLSGKSSSLFDDPELEKIEEIVQEKPKVIELFRNASSKSLDSQSTLVASKEQESWPGALDQDLYNSQMQQLIKLQNEEIQKMQERFKKQQEELLRKFCANKIEDDYKLPELDAANRTSTPLHLEPPLSDFSNLSSSQTLYLSNTITTDEDDNHDFFTCDKEDFEIDFQSPGLIDSYMDRIKNNFQMKGGNIQNELLKIQAKAATKINAFIRGFLTRRLYQTIIVQTHIQTIRDTLLLIVDLAHEQQVTGVIKTSDEDIQLKTRVLKQLMESCNRIHEIFFVIPIKERMELIRRDRERLEKKRQDRSLSRNASFTSQYSHVSRSSQRSDGRKKKMNNLQFCSL